MIRKYDQPERMLLLSKTMVSLVIAISIMFLIMSVVLIMQPVRRILEAKSEIIFAQAKGMELIPELEVKAHELEKQIRTLTTQSIENRLSKIEKAIIAGEIKTEDLQSLQELQKEFKKLQEYMFDAPERVIEFRTLQTQYSNLNKTLDKKMDSDDVRNEISSLKDLFYLTLAFMGILVSILAGAWFIALRRQIKSEKLIADQENNDGTEVSG